MRILPALIVFLLTAVLTELSAQDNENNLRNWSIGTAYTLPEGRWEVGVFHPLRYGFSDRVEFAAHPILFFVMPNFSLKWSQGSAGGFDLALRHSLTYPTHILRIASSEGTGGLISPEFDIPHMVELYNEFLFSRVLAGSHFITGKIGFSIAVKSDDLDSRALIDYPLAYHRLAVYLHGYGMRFGLDFQGNISGKFYYVIDADYQFIPGVKFNKAFESKGMIHWRFSNFSALCAGYKLIYGEYPYGDEWNIFLPMIDYQFAFD
jgi:hypothetical protein